MIEDSSAKKNKTKQNKKLEQKQSKTKNKTRNIYAPKKQ